MVLFIEDASETSLHAVFGTVGRSADAEFEKGSSGKWILKAPVTIYEKRRDFVMCPDTTTITSASLELGDFDDDGAIEASLVGTYDQEECSDDSSQTKEGAIDALGEQDSTPPSWKVSQSSLNPFQVFEVEASEPLVAKPVSLVSSGSQDAIALSPCGTSNHLVCATTDRVLAPGVSYAIETAASDLAGLPSAATTFTTIDPGILAEDGFESGTLQGVFPTSGYGAPSIIEDFHGIAPIAGTRSLFIPADNKALIRLRRENGQTRVLMEVRKVVPADPQGYSGGDFGFAEIGAAVVGGSLRTTRTVSDGEPLVAVKQGAILVNPVETIELELQEPGEDVLVQVWTQQVSHFGWSEESSLIIDDIRLE